ncbi:hypothetical protein [Streptococcus sp. sy018]|uniref:hypothetical protein n=1 Tax=Streptococcus sp. sy018 TaxID=2600147 RepID=UPI0011B45F72|nr:hypothetical protein [Streptococcus sp. sy018]TWS94566.1 hypothetical protein FRX52_03615 [Streptococcus sp. sy018]
MILTKDDMAGMTYQLSDGSRLPLEQLAKFFDEVEDLILSQKQFTIGDTLAMQLLAMNYNNQILNYLKTN